MGTTYNTSKSGSTSKTTTSSKSGSTSKTYASGQVSDKTQQNKDKYSNAYQQSDVVNQAYQKLQGLSQPEAFQSQYEEQMNALYDKYVNRGGFQFDVNENAMYQQLKDQYSALGKLAMQDTMGQAAGMTGGYGSSYAQTAGQQQYQNYMQQLQEQIPSLYQMELDRYNQEGESMLNQYNLAKNLYDTEYGEHRDAMSDYYTDRDYYNSLYQSERDFDYNRYQADRDYWTNQYWNEKNAESTTESSAWEDTVSTTQSSSWSSSESTSPDEVVEAKEIKSEAPTNWKFADQVLAQAREAMNEGSKEDAQDVLLEMYEAGSISEGNLNYFLDIIEGWK